MKCKSCKREIDDDSFFCKWCGKEVARGRKKKEEVNVPKPVRLKSGEWAKQVMYKGHVEYIKGATEAEYYAKARAWKSGLMQPTGHAGKETLRDIMRKYIDSNDGSLSPATIRGYEIIYRNRFRAYMDKPVDRINYQSMVSEEAKKLAPKTVVNSWALVSKSLKAAKYPVPDVNLPQVPESDEDWLDYEHILVFLEALRGSDAELAALLALHGLRLSEILALDVDQISKDIIEVKGAVVYDKRNKRVEKATNKTRKSRRPVPVLIPRLLELLPPSGKAVCLSESTINRRIAQICRKNSLPECSVHDLRRSFCSLAYHLKWNSQTTMRVGGWSNLQTVERVYRKLAEREKNEDIDKMRLFYVQNSYEISNGK